MDKITIFVFAGLLLVLLQTSVHGSLIQVPASDVRRDNDGVWKAVCVFKHDQKEYEFGEEGVYAPVSTDDCYHCDGCQRGGSTCSQTFKACPVKAGA